MTRRSPYSKVNKTNQIRAKHVRGMGDVVFKGFQCLNPACEEFIFIKADDINEDLIAAELSMRDLPDPDLFIRTGGEERISNFLIWQLAYTELYFTNVLWPDFVRDEFINALNSFLNRQRRFGHTGEQIEQKNNA